MIYNLVAVIEKDDDVTEFIRSVTATGYAAKLKLILVYSNTDNTPINTDDVAGFAAFSSINYYGDYSSCCNRAATTCDEEYILFLKASMRLDTRVFHNLTKNIQSANGDVAAYEFRQFPYETGQYYNPISLETKLLNASAFAIKRDVYIACGGIDSLSGFVVSCADISYKIAALGYKIIYLIDCKVVNVKVAENPMSEYIESLYAMLLLRYKYCGFAEIVKGHKNFLNAIRKPRHFIGIRRILLKLYLRQFVLAPKFLTFRLAKRKLYLPQDQNIDMVFTLVRERYMLEKLHDNPVVSVIVRSYNRSKYLMRALKSIENQTYKNIEVILCEDGKALSDKAVFKEYPKLDIKYVCDGVKKGRSKNGNIGLANATGEWCFFLDDDDYLYPDHVECMLAAVQRNLDVQVILGSAAAAFYNMQSDELIRLEPMVFDRIDVFTMCQKNRIPIQTGMFRRELFIKYGGLKEGIDAHEDWAMWLKFYKYANFSGSNCADVKRVTSVFVQDIDDTAMQRRDEDYARYNDTFFNDNDINFNVTLSDMRGYYRDVLRDIEHLYNNGELEKYLKMHK